MELSVFVTGPVADFVTGVYVELTLRVGVSVSLAVFLDVTVLEGEMLCVFVTRVERDPVADTVDVRLIMLERV